MYGKDSSEIISKSIQLLAGRIGQEYNQRKNRKGAFWEDRYHATAVETGEHLLRCIVYVDLNIVRAGVVEHPKDWPDGGYIEIQRPRRKNILIDYGALAHLCGYDDWENFQTAHRSWIEAALSGNQIKRDESWTQSIAIGNRSYIESVVLTEHRKIVEGPGKSRIKRKFDRCRCAFNLQATKFWDGNGLHWFCGQASGNTNAHAAVADSVLS